MHYTNIVDRRDVAVADARRSSVRRRNVPVWACYVIHLRLIRFALTRLAPDTGISNQTAAFDRPTNTGNHVTHNLLQPNDPIRSRSPDTRGI